MKFSEETLKEMNAELFNGPKIYRPSEFWYSLNDIHIKQLKESGLNNFKRTLNLRYFNWSLLGILAHQLSPFAYMVKKLDFSPLFDSRFDSYGKDIEGVKKSSFMSSFVYKCYVCALFNYVSRIDRLKVFNKIQEPQAGNPFSIRYKNKTISQDLCNSVHEFYSIIDGVGMPKKSVSIAELGAGYGRVGYVFLNMLPNSSYTIIDIPPALYVSQEYLSAVFPKAKVFKFRRFNKFSDVKKEFESARIRFLMPHQMELLPEKYFDIMMNINSLQEMGTDQIENFMKQFERLCNGYFYTKQWLRSIVKDNSYIKEDEYPIPAKWEKMYSREHPIQSMFFEALYMTNHKK